MKKILLTILLLTQSLLTAQVKITSVNFEGNDYFSSTELRNFMVLRPELDFSEQQLNSDLISIREQYKRNGYLSVVIDSVDLRYNSDTSSVNITVNISEGGRVTIGEMIFSGITVFSDDEIKNSFETKTGGVLFDDRLSRDISELLLKYESKGLPFAKAEVESIEMYDENGSGKLRVNINIIENERIEISEIKIKGNDDTKESVILREVKIPQDGIVTVSELDAIKKRLERLDIFSEVKTPSVYTVRGQNKSGLLIEVTEGNTNTFDGIIGYIPPPTNEENGYFTGLVNVSFRNLFGSARKISARWEQEVRETQELEFKYSEPYFFSSPFDIDLGFLQRIQDTTYTRRKFDVKADYPVFSDLKISGILGFDRVIPADIENPVFVIADSRILETGASIQYDKRDDIYFPRNGFFFQTYYSYGDKKVFNFEQLQHLGYKEKFSVQRYSALIDYFISFTERQSTLLRGFAGEIRSDKLEDSDYFRVGGNRNIRGYREEQFLASKFTYGTIEPRYSLTRRSFLMAFFDFGYYFKPEDEVNKIPEQSGFLYGYGIGMRIETALGLIGISYALGKGDSFLDGKIHFGLINSF